MKLWPGWEKDCTPADEARWGAGVYRGKKPGNLMCQYYRYQEHCSGCGEPFLSQARRVNGHYEYSEYCSKACFYTYSVMSEETRKLHSYNALHRSPETVQRVLEANRRPRSLETRQKVSRSLTGRTFSDDTKSKMRDARLGFKYSVEAITKSVLGRRSGDRELVAINVIRNRYENNAKVHRRVFTLTPDEFATLIKRDCYYCGGPPSRPVIIKSRGDICSLPDDIFFFNGIDRWDTSRGYEISNVVTACSACNLAKSSRSVTDFLAWALRVSAFSSNRPDDLFYYGDIQPEQHARLITIYRRYHQHQRKTIKEGKFINNTIALPEFARLIRTQCYYCGAGLNNLEAGRHKKEKDNITLAYNGLDRLDSALDYSVENVVPCCIDCNRAKNKTTLDDFCAWVARLTAHISSTPKLLDLVNGAPSLCVAE